MIMMMMSTFIAQDSINVNAQCSEGGDRETVIRPDSVSIHLTLFNLLVILPPVEFMYLVFTRICQVRVTVGDSGLCCCACVTSFER